LIADAAISAGAPSASAGAPVRIIAFNALTERMLCENLCCYEGRALRA
jgi:hypothetical protein